jgi:hypothetical protein
LTKTHLYERAASEWDESTLRYRCGQHAVWLITEGAGARQNAWAQNRHSGNYALSRSTSSVMSALM